MGFSAGDLAISVPYVNASIKAEKKEREQSEQVRWSSRKSCISSNRTLFPQTLQSRDNYSVRRMRVENLLLCLSGTLPALAICSHRPSSER
jgi:hypothetical protein